MVKIGECLEKFTLILIIGVGVRSVFFRVTNDPLGNIPSRFIIYIVKMSYSESPTLDSFEKISNETPFVNIFMIFLTTLNFELQILNHHCDPN